MDEKSYLTNRSFCPIPWTGLMYNFNGDVKTCIRSSAPIGNIKDNLIQEILSGELNNDTRNKMLNNQPGNRCSPCYDLEKGTKSFDIISDRIFYLKELRDVSRTLYDDPTNFSLHTIDVRWSNLCNFACVYCSGEFSSRWATETGTVFQTPDSLRLTEFKNYVLDNVDQLKHVYLAGGEPLLMKENLELLRLLKERNPDVNLRINTNLSKVDTRVFETVCEFKNVHWIISLETIEEEYEYIRYGGSWADFVENLTKIKKLDHRVSFNMLYFLLNYRSIFDCIRFLQAQGFHNNSFIVGALLMPEYLNVRHLPDHMLVQAQKILQEEIAKKPGFLLENGLNNVLQYTMSSIVKNTQGCLDAIADLDRRRGLNSRTVFKEFYSLIEGK